MMMMSMSILMSMSINKNEYDDDDDDDDDGDDGVIVMCNRGVQSPIREKAPANDDALQCSALPHWPECGAFGDIDEPQQYRYQ